MVSCIRLILSKLAKRLHSGDETATLNIAPLPSVVEDPKEPMKAADTGTGGGASVPSWTDIGWGQWT